MIWHKAGDRKKLTIPFLIATLLGCVASILMFYFCQRWYDSYDSMLKYPDGEWHYDDIKNDYSDETVDAKMKYYWLFDWETSTLFSFLG